MRKVGRTKKKMWIILSVIFVCIGIATLIILPPSLGRPKPFSDENGKVLKGSISEKIFVKINDTEIGMFITAKDQNNPVLLFLSGGPGIPEYLMEQWYPTGLANEFVVCYPDYRGTALSYDPNANLKKITLDQYIDDAIGITNYLRERFGQGKIYLIGHSFGTYIGINVVERHPELYNSYIAMAQITDQKKSETIAFDYMYEQYEAQGNNKMTAQFEKYPIHTSEDAFVQYTSSSLRDNAMHDLGVGTTHDMRSVISGIFFPSLRRKAYSPLERINIWKAKSFVRSTSVATGIWNYNAFKEIPQIDIPIYFWGGIHDYTCVYSLQKEYYEKIEAPMKAFYTFDNSAHSPLFEEPEKAMEILSKDVLAGSTGLSDDIFS